MVALQADKIGVQALLPQACQRRLPQPVGGKLTDHVTLRAQLVQTA